MPIGGFRGLQPPFWEYIWKKYFVLNSFIVALKTCDFLLCLNFKYNLMYVYLFPLLFYPHCTLCCKTAFKMQRITFQSRRKSKVFPGSMPSDLAQPLFKITWMRAPCSRRIYLAEWDVCLIISSTCLRFLQFILERCPSLNRLSSYFCSLTCALLVTIGSRAVRQPIIPGLRWCVLFHQRKN